MARRRPLVICAIGYAQSIHVSARVRCFAELGHRVFLITETASVNGIPGVSELVPALDPAIAKNVVFRGTMWFCRRVLKLNADHLWRAIMFVRLVRSCRPDIVHVHFARSYYGWMAALCGCRPLVVTVMGGDVLFDEQGAVAADGRLLTVELLRRADYITSKSNYITAILDQLGGFGAKAERIIWGIPLRDFHRINAESLRSSLGLSPQQQVILSPRILQPLYRVHLLVEAMSLVIPQCPDAVLLVTEYGADPEYRAQIIARVAALDLEKHVRFCGAVPHRDMPSYYSLATVAAAVPSSDGMPQTLLEGMACETPNILSRLPRYEEIVRHEVSAYFVDATAEAIANAIVRLLQDDRLRATIAINALEIVRRDGDLTEQAKRVEQRYFQLTARIPPRVISPLRLWSSLRTFARARALAKG